MKYYRTLCFIFILLFPLQVFSSTNLNPMIPERDPALQQQINHALKIKGTNYQPRTRHFKQNGMPQYTNRLILEASPYLLQHAHNPVDWYSWSDEAFTKAKQENKPIFLSIGYSTCHWCHVMEHESFEDPKIAALINQYFIPIKVDREQRPDIDQTYMTAVMLITGHGGWPMSSFLTPKGETFYAGTYFPPDRFTNLLNKIHQLWQISPAILIEQAEKVSSSVREINQTSQQSQQLNQDIFKQAVNELLSSYDEMQGGFSQAPKFPHEPLLYFALNQLEHDSYPKLKKAIIHTLTAMANGGIYDQIAGGFHRYATDNGWLVPHFEKMLYNQAHLSRNYIHAWKITANPTFKRIAQATLDYTLKEMQNQKGGFYSATDADSNGVEGEFFSWDKTELKQQLSADEFQLISDLYGLDSPPNFEGRYIFALTDSLEDYAKQKKIPLQNFLIKINYIHQKLYKIREQRPKPLRDDKILTAWNGMMITALVEAGIIFDDPEYRNQAKKTAEFIWQTLFKSQQQLMRVYLAGKTSIPANQEDYAYLAEAFIYLYDMTLEQKWLKRAIELTDIMITKFWDQEQGGFFMNQPNIQASSMGRPKDIGDNAIPSGNSVAFHVLSLLSRRTDHADYTQKAQKIMGVLAHHLIKMPSSAAYLLMAIENFKNGEQNATQFAAKGALQIQATIKQQQLILTIKLDPKWHINAHQPKQKDLIGTDLKIINLDQADIQYPQPELLTMGFSKEKLSLYQGLVKIKSDLPKKWLAQQAPLIKIKLKLQACNDKNCLAPETLIFNLIKNNE